MKPELQAHILRLRNNEATSAVLYAMLAKRTKSHHNKRILEAISLEETKHCDVWGSYANGPPLVNHCQVCLFSILARIFGVTFVINLMESLESEAAAAYAALGQEVPIAQQLMVEENRHEASLAAMIEEDALSYISSMVLGLNDALVELTGTLAGFTFALNDNTVIGLAGFITGIAATLSMGSSEYLAKRADPHEKHPLKAAIYTALAYLLTLAVLLTPYALSESPLTALLFCCVGATLIITGFTFFVSVVRKESFWKGFREMMCISFGVACISFLIGWAAKAWLSLGV